MKYFVSLNLILFIMCISSCAGITFPRIFFEFHDTGNNPPYNPEKRFQLVSEGSPEIDIIFRQPGNSFEKFMQISLLVDTPYKTMNIKEMRIKWDNNTHILFRGTSYSLPSYISDTGDEVDSYYFKNNYYWTTYVKYKGNKNNHRSINFEKVFKDKRVGDRFKVTIEIDYNFDDNAMKTQELDFGVRVIKNSYVSPLMGW